MFYIKLTQQEMLVIVVHTFFSPSKDLFFSTSSSVNQVGMQCSSVATDSFFFIYSLLLVQKR